MRPVALSRKNSLFANCDEGGRNLACLASLIETCKRNNINPQTYITDDLTTWSMAGHRLTLTTDALALGAIRYEMNTDSLMGPQGFAYRSPTLKLNSSTSLLLSRCAQV
jgi:hypothetical protein